MKELRFNRIRCKCGGQFKFDISYEGHISITSLYTNKEIFSINLEKLERRYDTYVSRLNKGQVSFSKLSSWENDDIDPLKRKRLRVNNKRKSFYGSPFTNISKFHFKCNKCSNWEAITEQSLLDILFEKTKVYLVKNRRFDW